VTGSPYDHPHLPDCGCPDCRKAIPGVGIPRHIKAELAELKAKWATEQAAEEAREVVNRCEIRDPMDDADPMDEEGRLPAGTGGEWL